MQVREQLAKRSNGSLATTVNEAQTKTTRSRGRKADAAAAAHSTRQSKQIQSAVNPRTEIVNEHADAGRKDELAQLRKIIETQQSEIKLLRDRLKYILSYLGIDDIELEGEDESSNVPSQCDQNAGVTSDDETGENANKDKDITAGHSTRSDITTKPIRQHQANDFRQSLVAAVYVDQSLKQHRQTSLIVSGLAPSTTVSDMNQVKSLCETELNLPPNIVTTKRLGRSLQDKIQPLLVVLQSAEQAQQIISNARQLRKSANETVRTKVYINPNLTRAEAEAAYHVRVQRREATKRRSAQQPQKPQQLCQEIQQQQQIASQTGTSINDESPRAPNNVENAQSISISNSGSTNGRRA